MTKPPFVSVVMPSFNQREFIEQSINSVLKQDHTYLELIVADGASTDGTQQVLETIAQKDKRLKWLSKPDTGPAEAINRALNLTKGTIVGWLNSDDLYTPGAIHRALDTFENHQHTLLIYGQGEHIDKHGHFINTYPTMPPSAGIQAFANGCFICQPTVFFKKTMHTLLGDLDPEIKASFDYDYWMRAFSSFPDRIHFIDVVQAQSRLHENCITQKNRRTVALEGIRIVSKYLGEAPIHWLTTYIEEYLASSQEEGTAVHDKDHILDLLEHVVDHVNPEELNRTRQQVLDTLC